MLAFLLVIGGWLQLTRKDGSVFVSGYTQSTRVRGGASARTRVWLYCAMLILPQIFMISKLHKAISKLHIFPNYILLYTIIILDAHSLVYCYGVLVCWCLSRLF